MSSKKRWNFPSVFTKNGSCGCSKRSIDIIQPERISKQYSDQKHRSCASRSPDGDGCCGNYYNNSTAAKIIRNSLAVVKVSEDPYGDFRQSMVQMIAENEMYSRDDLEELLRCFLELNSPQHHQLIVKAFVEICNSGEGGREESTSTPPWSSESRALENVDNDDD